MDKEKKTQQPEEKTPPKFEIDRLRQDCKKLFGISPSTFEGAVFGLEGQFTVEEMRTHINKWMKGVVN